MYLDEGKLQQLLSFSKDFPSELTDFIESHPYLAWLHYLATQDYMAVMRFIVVENVHRVVDREAAGGCKMRLH